MGWAIAASMVDAVEKLLLRVAITFIGSIRALLQDVQLRLDSVGFATVTFVLTSDENSTHRDSFLFQSE